MDQSFTSRMSRTDYRSTKSVSSVSCDERAASNMNFKRKDEYNALTYEYNFKHKKSFKNFRFVILGRVMDTVNTHTHTHKAVFPGPLLA